MLLDVWGFFIIFFFIKIDIKLSKNEDYFILFKIIREFYKNIYRKYYINKKIFFFEEYLSNGLGGYIFVKLYIKYVIIYLVFDWVD